jgi:branched-chain amino acid aminotransferase
MRGDGLFETLRSYSGRIFRLEEHLARLDHGLQVLHYVARSADLDLQAAAEETLRASGVLDARVRIQVTRGIGTTEFNARSDAAPTVLITVHPILNPGASDPLDVIVARGIRRDEMSPLSGIKTVNYLPSILARREAEIAGADDAILLNYAGNVAEGCASNIFLFRSGILITPDIASGALPGIIRLTILEIARDLGIPVEERHVALGELEIAEEVFMTSSTREVAPVATINARKVGSGSHEVAELLEREYRART